MEKRLKLICPEQRPVMSVREREQSPEPIHLNVLPVEVPDKSPALKAFSVSAPLVLSAVEKGKSFKALAKNAGAQARCERPEK